MTDREAIEALKLINLSRVHPFYDWEEMLAVRDLAIFALQERIDREKGCGCCIDLAGNSLPAKPDRMFCLVCGRNLKADMPGEV